MGRGGSCGGFFSLWLFGPIGVIAGGLAGSLLVWGKEKMKCNEIIQRNSGSPRATRVEEDVVVPASPATAV